MVAEVASFHASCGAFADARRALDLIDESKPPFQKAKLGRKDVALLAAVRASELASGRCLWQESLAICQDLMVMQWSCKIEKADVTIVVPDLKKSDGPKEVWDILDVRR